MTTQKYWWIDDEKKRVVDLIPGFRKKRGRGANARSVDVELIHTPTGVWAPVEERIQQAKKIGTFPDLILIDQMLQNRGHSLSFKGSSLAMALRGEIPSVPIVLLSAGDAPLSRQKNEGVDFFKLESIQAGQRFEDLWAIAEGFATINRNDFSAKNKTILTLITDLVGVPTEDRGLFADCIPGQFLMPWDAEMAHSFARWMWKVFLNRPGFLLDEMHLATTLGVRPEGLEVLKKPLLPCLYQHAFASEGRPRWWSSTIRPILERLKPAYADMALWEIGRDLTGKQFHSKAYGHPPKATAVPDCVAWQDERRQTPVQALQHDTIEVPYDTPGMGYLPQRVFQGVRTHAATY